MIFLMNYKKTPIQMENNMKKSTKILGIFIVSILLLSLIALFIAKAYIDSKSETLSSMRYNITNFWKTGQNFYSKLNYKVDIDDLNNIKKIENSFFEQSDNFIKNNTRFNIKQKEELILTNNIGKELNFLVNATKAVYIFSDNEIPRITYKFYTNNDWIKEPVKIDKLSNSVSILKDIYFNKFNDEIYMFAFIVLPAKFNFLNLESNISSIQIGFSKLLILDTFNIDSDTSNIDIQSKEIFGNKFELDIDASNIDLNIERINCNNSILIDMDASNLTINSKFLKVDELKFDFDASNSKISSNEVEIKSLIDYEEDAGNCSIIFEKFLVYPSNFTINSNASKTFFEFKNCQSFFIKGNINGALTAIKTNGQTNKFASDFELKSNNKIDEKNILKIN